MTLKAANAVQAAEDRPVVERRRQQEEEEDKVASTHHRRTGLPTRALIEKVGGEWSGRVGGADRQVAHVANALSARRISLEAAQTRSWRRARGSSGKPHDASTPDEYIEAKDGTIVLARHLQNEVLASIDHNWRQTKQGQHFVQKARDNVRVAAAARKQQRGRRRPASTLDHGRGAGASTPDQTVGASTPDHAVGTEKQFEKEMKKYFRNHCDKAYGGSHWLKFLITLDDIPEKVVHLTNILAIYRTKERGNLLQSSVPDDTPGNIYLSRKTRASTPVADDFIACRNRRHKAYCRVRKLEAWKDLDKEEGTNVVSQRTMDFAMQELRDADAASVASGFKFKNYWGDWKNDFDSMQYSQFEMVLRWYLTDYLKFDDEQLGAIVNKRNPHEAGSASTPALTQGSASTPAQGGKGGGQGGGRGGKGGDRGGGQGGKGGRGDKGGDRGGGKGGRGDKGGGQGGGQDRGGKDRKGGGSFRRVGPPATI